METTMSMFYSSSLLYLVPLIFSTFLLHPSLSEFCNPQDKEALLKIKKALLKIKKAFNNPEVLASWTTTTDCCNWDLVDCSNDNHVTSLKLIDIESLTGKIPPEIGDLEFLEYLEFNRLPNLVGPIPPSVGNLNMLRFLTVSLTNVSGPIPEEIANLKNVEFIDLFNNRLTGSIPKSIGWLPKLAGLRLDKNKITGEIPESFGDFKVEDFYLYLSNNQLSGKIPPSMEKKDFTFIDLSNNKLEGDAAPLLASKKKMQLVDLSGNLLKFDMSKVNFPRTLIFLDLSENKVFGSLPEELTELTSLKSLNVSYNRLCGKIPVGGNLQKFGPWAYFHNICLCSDPLQSCRSLTHLVTLGVCLVECTLSRYLPL